MSIIDKFKTNILGRIVHTLIGYRNNYVRALYKKKCKHCGKNVWIGDDCILTPETITFGDYSKIGNRCELQSTNGEIILGTSARLGDGVNIHGGNHVYDKVGKYIVENAHDSSDGKVVIGNDTWIGANVIILKGVKIGDGSIVGSGAIVTKDIPPYSIAVGVPAKVVGKRFSDEELKKHLKIMDSRKEKGDLRPHPASV